MLFIVRAVGHLAYFEVVFLVKTSGRLVALKSPEVEGSVPDLGQRDEFGSQSSTLMTGIDVELFDPSVAIGDKSNREVLIFD